jgi:hypothetical protein
VGARRPGDFDRLRSLVRWRVVGVVPAAARHGRVTGRRRWPHLLLVFRLRHVGHTVKIGWGRRRDNAGGYNVEMRRALRSVCWLAAVVGLLGCVACFVAYATACRVDLISSTRRYGVDAGVDEAKLCVAWRFTVPARPAWAGQVNRLGFRYTRWSDGSGEVRVPLLALAAGFGVVGVAAYVVARRLRPARGAKDAAFEVVTHS